MGWIQAVVAGLLVTTIVLAIQMGYGVDYYCSSRQQKQQQPHLQLRSQQQQQEEEEDKSRCFPALFSFGSSVADTGTQPTALPFQPSENPPYGFTFFGKPANRYGDGRINIDFWASALKIPFLDPYLKSVGSNFRRGANFASAGATACNSTSFSPFSLSTQLNQFRCFKRDVVAIRRKGSISSSQNNDDSRVPLEEDFRNALYIIAIGGNDILKWSVVQEVPLPEIELLVPKISKEILRVVEALHSEGARHILVEDIFPQGCTPYFLTDLSKLYHDQLDAIGCLKPINDIVQRHNSLLRQGIAELGKRLPDASISFVDTYRRRYSIIVNHEQYGFREPIKSCCGSGGEYNYRPDCPCGKSITDNGVVITGGMCDNVSSHVVWDSLHYTEAFNRATMKGILSGDYFEPRFDLIGNGCALVDI